MAFRPDLKAVPLYEVPSPVHFEFCRVMDVLLDRDWIRFASEVLSDITALRLTEREGRRTDSVMLQWQNRNGSVGQLLDLLQRLQLLEPWDIINNWASSLPPRVAPPPAPYRAPPPDPSAAPPPDPPAAPPSHPPAAPPTCPYSQSEMAKMLPKPQPPESRSTVQSELSSVDSLPRPLSTSQPPPAAAAAAAAFSLGMCTSGVMAWAYEEVHAGTRGFSAAFKVGEGGFGEVYRANLRNMDCAVKKFKKDCSLDWSLLRNSFQTEVEKLSRFRHQNIVDLLGYSVGGGTYCLIYSFMANSSLDDKLRSNSLSWAQRVSIAKGAANALQYLHSPPGGQTQLVHGDVKSSNILLDRHMEAKLADFGLAQFMPHSSLGRTAAQTCSFGKTQEVRGTLAYLPEDYMRRSCKLNTAVDVYCFGVVLLEIVTGQRALEKDKKTGRDIYLKDLVNKIEDDEEWRKQLDRRLLSGGAAEPTGFMQVLSLARSCCCNKWKKRPSMKEVYETLFKLHVSLDLTCSSPLSLSSVLPCSGTTPSYPQPPRSLDSLSALSLNNQGPSEHTYNPKQSSLSLPQTLHTSTVTPTGPPHASSSLPPMGSSFDGPCETDESRGYSQYDFKSNGFGTEQSKCEQNCLPQPSLPTEDHYIPNMNQACGLPECSSQAESLQSVVLNPSKQRLLENIARYDQRLIQTPELLSDDLYLVQSPAASRLPEESDELEYL